MAIGYYLPESIVDWIRNTPIETAYWKYRVKTTGSEPVTVKLPSGEIKINIPESETWFPEKYSDREYEPAYFTSLEEDLGPDSVYYDVGSRWGICISGAKEIGVPADSIHGFEANSLNYKTLQDNHGKTGTHLTKGFVSDTETVESVSLDSYAKTHADPSVAKIDVEGAEFAVLRGMENILDDTHPILYVEVHPELLRRFDNTQFDVIELLEGNGYSLTRAEDHRDRDTEWGAIDRESLPSDGDYMIRAE